VGVVVVHLHEKIILGVKNELGSRFLLRLILVSPQGKAEKVKRGEEDQPPRKAASIHAAGHLTSI
jgi:hypothetical protein